MSKFRGPKVKKIRKFGELPGFSQKKPKKKNAETTKDSFDFEQLSEFSYLSARYKTELLEKQKFRLSFCLTKSQLKSYLKQNRISFFIKKTEQLKLLESRIDYILFRANFASTILEAKQFINHKHILINDSSVTVPNFFCKPGDVISIKNDKSCIARVLQNIEIFGKNFEKAKDNLKENEENQTLFNFPERMLIPAFLKINLQKIPTIELIN